MITKFITDLFSFSTSLFFPCSCYICKKETAQALCEKCILTFSKPIDTPAPFIISLYSFKDLHLKKIIHAIKYFHRKDLLIPFIRILTDEIKKMDDYQNYVLVPIPMPQLRKYIRGYNHTEVLAKGIANELGVSYSGNILENSTLPIRRQVMTRSRYERLLNKHNAFIIHRDVRHLHIILIDDVTTTGATLSEARKVLLKHGASRITAYTIAH